VIYPNLRLQLLPSHSWLLLPIGQQVRKGITKLIAVLILVITGFYIFCHIMEIWGNVLTTEKNHCAYSSVSMIKEQKKGISVTKRQIRHKTIKDSDTSGRRSVLLASWRSGQV
jgi:hypothetical protein